MRKLIKALDKRINRFDDLMNELLGNKLPEWLENNMRKIYFIFFLLTLIGIKEAYHQRGYFAIGGEFMIMMIPLLIRVCLEIRKDNKRYYNLMKEMEELDEEGK